MPSAKARAWLVVPLALLAIAAVVGVDLAQSKSPLARRIDSWSGLIVTCQTDAKLALSVGVCNDVVAETKRQAGAGNVKFVVLAAGDGPEIETAKAKAAGIDDAKAIELQINIRNSDSTTVIAALEVDALSRLHIMPARPGQPTQYAKIYTQTDIFSRDASDWVRMIAPTAKHQMAAFFDIYLKPARPVHN